MSCSNLSGKVVQIAADTEGLPHHVLCPLEDRLKQAESDQSEAEVNCDDDGIDAGS